MHHWLLIVACYFVAVNALAIWRFRDDKRRARLGLPRVPERALLGLALIGGTPGALFARRAYRHKTRKQPFSSLLFLIALAQLAAMIALMTLR